MRKIAIISDIHGNIYALDAVLKDIKKQEIEMIYCLGDMVGIGPFSNEVLETLFTMDNIRMITGNHEESILSIVNNQEYPKSRINVISHHEWISNRINKDYIDALSKLPRQINEIFNGTAVQFIHYPMNPSSYSDPISKDPFDKIGMPTVENFSKLIDLKNTDLVCFGHDHSHHLFTCNDTTFYNTGSLGYYNKPFARYGIIEFDSTGVNILQQNIPYELEKHIFQLTNSSIPRKEIILKAYS